MKKLQTRMTAQHAETYQNIYQSLKQLQLDMQSSGQYETSVVNDIDLARRIMACLDRIKGRDILDENGKLVSLEIKLFDSEKAEQE